MSRTGRSRSIEPDTISKFTTGVLKSINDQIVAEPSKPDQHLVKLLHRRELGVRTKVKSNIELQDCILRTPSRSYRSTDVISGSRMIYSKRGHLFQCHPNPALFNKDDLYRKWECCQYLPGEKYRDHRFIEMSFDCQKGTGPESYLVLRTSFQRLIFIDCENETVLKVYQLPNKDFKYGELVYSVLKNELYIEGSSKDSSIVVVFELSPLRLKMCYEMEKKTTPDQILFLFDGSFASYNSKRRKLQIQDMDEIYKQFCFDIDESPAVNGVIPIKRNVLAKTVQPSLAIECRRPENMYFIGDCICIQSQSIVDDMFTEFRSLNNPGKVLFHASNGPRLSGNLWNLNSTTNRVVSYESRILEVSGTFLRCFHVEKHRRHWRAIEYNQLWSHDFSCQEVKMDQQAVCPYAHFLQLYTEGPYVYYTVYYCNLNPVTCLIDGSTTGVTIIFVASLETGQVLKTMLAEEGNWNCPSPMKNNSLMVTDDGDICYQSQDFSGTTTVSLFSLTDQESLDESAAKFKKAANSVQGGLNRRQRRQQRRNAGATEPMP